MRCRFCGAERPEGAGACPACGERPAPAEAPAAPVRWWQSNATIIIALAVAGPFALPLVWTNPKYKLFTKAALTVMVVLVTVWAIRFTEILLRRMADLLSMAGS